MSLYDGHYKLVAMTKLATDPRVKKRANGRAFGTLLFGLLITCLIGNLSVAVLLHWDRILGSSPITMLCAPWHIFQWSLDYFWHTYPSPTIDAFVHHAFTEAWIITLSAFFCTIVWTRLEYVTGLRDHSNLTTEKGDADWASPEEIAEAELLPLDYDLYKGFNAATIRAMDEAAARARASNQRRAATLKKRAQTPNA